MIRPAQRLTCAVDGLVVERDTRHRCPDSSPAPTSSSSTPAASSASPSAYPTASTAWRLVAEMSSSGHRLRADLF